MTVETVPVDVDTLPPTQYLILEVLAARARTGETNWSFPTSLERALLALQSAGLVATFGSTRPKTVRARLTDAGKSACLSDTWPGIRVTAVVNWKRERVHGITADPDEAKQWVREICARHGDPLAASACVDVVRAGQRREVDQ
jgi:hypothetical protein